MCLDIVQKKGDRRRRLALCGLSFARLEFNEASTVSAKTHHPGQGSSPSVTMWIVVITEMVRGVLEGFSTLIFFFPPR